MSVDLPTPECIEACAADPTGHHLAVARKVLAFPIPLFIQITNNSAVAAAGAGDQAEGARVGANPIGPDQPIQAGAAAACFHDPGNQMHAGSRQAVAIKGEHILIG